MKLYLMGHTFRYALEQIQMSLVSGGKNGIYRTALF